MVKKVRTLYWSHLSSYEGCPQQSLWQYGWGDIDLGAGPGKPKPLPLAKSKHHAVMGTVIQAVLEDFYNKDFWKYPEGLKQRLIDLTKEKLTATLAREYIDWDEAPSLAEMEEVCVDGVLGYLETMKAHRFLGVYAKSEVRLYGWATKWLPLGGKADFVIRREDTGITLLDGKNSATKMKWVDPDQLRWYALCFSLSYHKLPDRIGFVWFRYPYDPEEGETGVDWVDFTKRDLTALVERAKKVRRGQEAGKFDPTPTYKTCRFCDYESVCEARQEAKKNNSKKRKRKNTSLPVINTDGGVIKFGFDSE